MRHRSETWVKLAKRGRFEFETKARIGATEYVKISAPQIDRTLMSTPLSVGNCLSATLGLSILTDDNITSSTPIVILGRLTDGKIHSEWKEFGTFYINQRDTSYAGLVTVSCFDAMLKANQNYLDETDNIANWPKTMKAVVEEIAYRIGVSIDPRTLINVGEDYIVHRPVDLTMMQVLGYIGACHGGNWIITEENALRLVPLATSPDVTYHIIDNDYESIKTGDGSTLVYKEQEVFNAVLPDRTGVTPDSVIKQRYYITDEFNQPIVTPEGHFLVWAADGSADAVDGLINVPAVLGQLTTGDAIIVTGVTMSSNDGKSYTTGNADGGVITIEGNPYATQGICDALFAAFNGLVYEPYTASKAVYDPATELGDQVKISDKVHSVLYNATMSLDIAFRSNISAPNSEALSEEYPYLSEIKKLKQTTADLNKSIETTAKELTEKIDNSAGDTAGLTEALSAEVKRATDTEKEINTRIGEEEKRSREAETALSERIKGLEDLNPEQSATDVTELKKAVNANTEGLKKLSEEVSGQGVTVGKHTEEIASIKEKDSSQDTAIQGLQETQAAHGNSLTALQEKDAAHDKAITALQEKDTGYDKAIGEIKTEVEALKNADTALSQSITALHESLTAQGEKLGTLEQSSKDHDTAIAGLTERMSNAETVLAEYEQTLASIQESLTSIIARLEALENAPPPTGGGSEGGGTE